MGSAGTAKFCAEDSKEKLGTGGITVLADRMGEPCERWETPNPQQKQNPISYEDWIRGKEK